MNPVTQAVEMPAALKVRTSTFEAVYRQSVEGETGGGVHVWDIARPLYRLEFATGPMSPAELQAWRGFLAGRRGSSRTFLAWDKWAERPLAFVDATDLDGVTFDSTTDTFDATTWTFDEVVEPWGNPQLTAVDADSGTISTDGWISGAQLNPGDALSWFDGINWNRVTIGGATVTVVGANGQANGLTVEPYLTAHPNIAGYGLPLPLRIERACCEMIISGRPDISLSHDQIGTVSFQAGQIIRSRAP